MDSFRKSFFDFKGNSVDMWLMSATSLLAASNILNKEIRKLRGKKVTQKKTPLSFHAVDPDFMLKGFAIECILKASWLKNGGKLASNGRFMGITGVKSSHDLVQLIKISRTPNINTQEMQLLSNLTKYTTAYGRYPIPKKWEEDEISLPDNHLRLFKSIILKIVKQKGSNLKGLKQIKDILALVTRSKNGKQKKRS